MDSSATRAPAVRREWKGAAVWLFTDPPPPTCVFVGLASVVARSDVLGDSFFYVAGKGLHDRWRRGRLEWGRAGCVAYLALLHLFSIPISLLLD